MQSLTGWQDAGAMRGGKVSIARGVLEAQPEPDLIVADVEPTPLQNDELPVLARGNGTDPAPAFLPQHRDVCTEFL